MSIRRTPIHTYSESVMIAVVGGFEFEQHEIDGPVRGSDEEDLHDGVVNRDEVGQQVQVARRENEREQDLRLARDACRETRPKGGDGDRLYSSNKQVTSFFNRATQVYLYANMCPIVMSPEYSPETSISWAKPLLLGQISLPFVLHAPKTILILFFVFLEQLEKKIR